MRRTIRTAALSAILLVPLVISAPADWGALTSAQPAPSYTYQGTVRAVNARAGTLELITGVGMSLRVVRVKTAPTTRLVAAGAAPRLADLKPADVATRSKSMPPHSTPRSAIRSHKKGDR